MKLYHATSRRLWEDMISKQGLIPICDPNIKNVSNCDEAIYFSRTLNGDFGAEDYAQYRGGVEGTIILEVDIEDVLDGCQSVELDHHHWPYTVLATPWYIQNGEMYRDRCEIPVDKIRIARG